MQKLKECCECKKTFDLTEFITNYNNLTYGNKCAPCRKSIRKKQKIKRNGVQISARSWRKTMHEFHKKCFPKQIQKGD